MMKSLTCSFHNAILLMALILVSINSKGESEAQRTADQTTYQTEVEASVQHIGEKRTHFISRAKYALERQKAAFNTWLDGRTNSTVLGITSINNFRVSKAKQFGYSKMDPGVKGALILGLIFFGIGIWFGYSVGHDENNDVGAGIGSALLYGLLFGVLGAILGYFFGKRFSRE